MIVDYVLMGHVSRETYQMQLVDALGLYTMKASIDDGKPEEQIAQRIWKAIKPTHERPYRTDIDS